MAKKNFDFQTKEKKSLGVLIHNLRVEKNISLRKFAITIGLPPSNVTYIENGNNAPTAEIYAKVIGLLQPSTKDRRKMDDLYSKIRNSPPPDVCAVLLKNSKLSEKLKLLDGVELSQAQLINIEKLFISFKN